MALLSLFFLSFFLSFFFFFLFFLVLVLVLLIAIRRTKLSVFIRQNIRSLQNTKTLCSPKEMRVTLKRDDVCVSGRNGR